MVKSRIAPSGVSVVTVASFASVTLVPVHVREERTDASVLQVEVDAILPAAIPSAAVTTDAGDFMRRYDVYLAAVEMLILPPFAIAAAQAVLDVEGQVRILRGGKGIAMDARAAR